MRSFVVASLALTLAAPALAQSGPPVPPPPPDDECDAFGGGIPAPPPQERPEGDAAVIDPGFGQVFVLSPPPNTSGAPRNIEIRLAGDINSLEIEPPHFTVDVIHNGTRVPFERDGARMTPLSPLAANETFIVRVEATDANPCPDCFFPNEIGFTTGTEIDLEAPVLDGPPPVHVFVLPSPEQAAQCGLFFGQTHQIVVDFGPALPINTFVSVAAKKEGEAPRTLFDVFNTGAVFPAVSDVGQQVPVALGDAFFVAVTPRDLAGNSGAARVVRVRARSFIDANLPREELAPLWCDMPRAPTLNAAATLPTNGQIVVEFPFEEVPVALQQADGELIPLVPLSDTAAGHVYGTATGMPAGAELNVVGLDCPHCICEGCIAFPAQSVVVGAGPDNSAPAAPVVRELREDASPSLSAAEECHPDRPALLVILEPGEDDQAAPTELRYDANIRIGDGPLLALGRALAPLDRGDGSVVVRIETPGLGRVLGDPFELTLEVADAAGNRASATHKHVEDEPTGCAAAGDAAVPGLGALAALGALGLRRRRR